VAELNFGENFMHRLALLVVLPACAVARIAAADAFDTFDNFCFQAKAIETDLNFPFSIDRLSSEVVFGSSTLGFGVSTVAPTRPISTIRLVGAADNS